MRLFESPGTIKRLRRTAWEFQQTFQTPSQNLARFVDSIMSALPRTEGAIAVFEQVVSEPSYDLVPLYAKYSLPQKYITFLAHRKGQLSGVVEALNGASFRAVEYVRKL